MNSRPGPGVHESLQNRGGPAPPRTQMWRQLPKPISSLHNSFNNSLPNAPPSDCIDPNLEAERQSVEESVAAKSRTPGTVRNKPTALEGIHTATSDVARPLPRGKPQLFFRNQTGSSSSSEPPTLPPLSQVLTLLPLPPRPGFVHPAEISGRTIPGGTGVKDDASAKWQAAEVTPPAAVLPGGGTADLSPWTGSQPEDTLSEALVKGGISNKPQIMNETNTARPSVWSNLKNKSGISTLSTVFVTVMDKKQSTGRLTTPNTFKPPPRLTLRDSTREQWLHDLANPAIPLRRLSRTIPHGLTGKVLLEQCLKKDIPLLRAVWLAQCVGTNELRAHKRKGQAGTVSWTRGWTISVEQFVDSVLGTIGQQDWKPRTTYALQLATHLYKEHLLDEDHFIDWLLKHLESCPFERLFVWLLMVGIGHYWQTLTSTRRLGKRLADALLCHTEKLRRLEEQGFTSDLSEYLENALIKLLAAEPACLLLPKTWETHGPLLRIITKKSEQPQAIQSFERLNERVQRLLRPSKSAPSSPQTSAGRIYHMLDSVNYSGSVRMEDLAFDCIKVMSDFRELIPTVLQWACSVHREGTHRIYLATRLLRRWSHADADVYDGVMSYLGRINTHEKGEQGEPRAIFRIIAELVRSRTFSIGRYLQWLIATGSLSQHQDLSLPSAWPLRLLTEIPLHGLPEQVKTLRYTLLRGSIYSIDMEERTFHDVKDAIRQRLPFVFDMFNMDANENELYTEKLSRTVRLEIGNWLRQQVAENMEMVERVPTKDPSIEESTKVSKITLSEFNIVRFFLERFDDLSMLADVINIVVTSLDPSVLASAADTLHYNHKAFRAIGAFDSLFQGIAMRYAALRTIRFPDRDLLLSLSDLSRTAGSSDDQLKQVLGYDVSRLEQRNSFAACSPVSDNMDVMQGTGYDNDDEIERILSSGTTMDQQMMARVFGKIIYNLEEQVAKGHIQSENHSTWFYRLRSFSETTFDLVLEEWLNSTLMGHRVQLLQAALPPLVGSGCMSLTKFQELGKSSVTRHKQSQPEEAFHIAIDTLKNLLPSRHLSTHCQPQDAYRYRLEQEKVCFEPDSKILESVRDVIELGSIQSSRKAKEEMSSLIRNDTFSMILKHHVISDPKSLWTANIVGHQNSEPISSCTKSLLDALLDPLDHMQLSQKTLEQQVLVIFEHVNELSLPFCQLLIHQILLMSTTLDGASAESISVALLGAVKVAVEKDQPLWSSLITGLESDISSKIREHAERELLSGSAFLTSPSRRETAQGSQDVSAFINRYLSVIDFTSAATHKDKQPYVLVALIERFRGLTEALSASKDISKRPGQPQCKVSVPVLSLWLKALLRIAVEHGSGLLQEATYPQQTALMWSMRSLLNHSAFETSPQMVDYIYDVTVSLSDSVADEVRTRVARLDGVKQVDNPRCSFIFGNVAPVDGWLNVTIPIELPLRPAVSQTQIQGSSQSQTLGQGHSSPSSPILHSQRSFGQLSSSSPTVPSQRSFGQQQQSSQQQQMQLQGRSFSQHSQQSQSGRAASPLQRMPSNFGQSTPSQFQQQQQMQPTQNFSQQRVNQSSGPAPQPQRVPSVSMQGAGTASKAGASRHDKPEVKHYPFILPRWETLPDSGSTSTGNDTAISLTLFGARKV